MAGDSPVDADLRRGRGMRIAGFALVTLSCVAAAAVGVTRVVAPTMRLNDHVGFWIDWAFAMSALSACIAWIVGSGRGFRFSLRNPKPRLDVDRCVPAKFDDSPTLHGDGWIEPTDAGLRVVAWASHRLTPWFAAAFAASWLAAMLAEGRPITIASNFLAPVVAAAALCRSRTQTTIARDDVVGATCFHGLFVVERRSAPPLRFRTRSVRDADAVRALSDIGCATTFPTSVRPKPPATVADLDATLGRLHAASDRLRSS